MPPTSQPPAPPGLADAFVPPQPAALTVLLRAYLLAQELGQDRWQCAVSLRALEQAGLDENDLRWLAHRGHIEHRLEATRPADLQRRFRRAGRRGFGPASCFALTEAGYAFACLTDLKAPPAAPCFRPCWDGHSELRLGGEAVKHFRQPAPSQKRVLDAFEEEGWPAWIDNPLGNDSNRTGEERLHDTVNKLNASQIGRWRLRFRLREAGRWVGWEVQPAGSEPGEAACHAALKRHLSGT